jgi:hypothetical protein
MELLIVGVVVVLTWASVYGARNQTPTSIWMSTRNTLLWLAFLTVLVIVAGLVVFS